MNRFLLEQKELWVVKPNAMNTDVKQQEIMIVAGTSFSQIQFSERDNKDEGKQLSGMEKLEQALWDGLLDELLPEIVTDKKLPIWLIWNSGISLQVELGEYPESAIWASINPYSLIKTMIHN